MLIIINKLSILRLQCPLLLQTLNETKYIVAYLQELWSQRNSHCYVTHPRENGRAVFSLGVSAATVAMQRSGKHASSTTEDVFSAWSLPRSYLKDNRRYNVVER
jgi:hypothetical protein